MSIIYNKYTHFLFEYKKNKKRKRTMIIQQFVLNHCE